MPGPPDFQRKLESIEELLHRIEAASDPHVRTTAQELVQAVIDLHAAGLERILEILRAAGAAGQTNTIDSLGRDDLVSSLLVLYGLHPVSLEDRLARALDKIRPSLKKRGAEVELLDVSESAVRLKLQANGHAAAMKELVESAVYEAAPDVSSLKIEGPEDRQGFVPLDMLLRGSLAANGKGGL